MPMVTLQSNADGTFTYTLDDANPLVDALGVGSAPLQDSFTYTVNDNHAGGNAMSANGTVTVTILPTNDAPFPVNDPSVVPGVYQADENGAPISIDATDGLLINDTDPDSNSAGVVAFDDSATLGTVTVDLTNGSLGALVGEFIDINEGTGLVGNRTDNVDQLYLPLQPYIAPGLSDFVLQRIGMTATGDAADVITPRIDFGTGTDGTQGDGSVLDRGGFGSDTVPPWQGLFNDLGVTADMDGNEIAGVWTGMIQITTAGDYTFTTRSDDGSVLFINGQQVVNNNNNQGMTNRSGTITLAAGMHAISSGSYEGGGGAGMQVSYSGPDTGDTRVIIPPNVLFNDVASPGNFVAGGLRGNYYDLNNPANNGGFDDATDEFYLNPTSPNDNVPFESLRAAVTQPVERIDFGTGTESVPGDGTVLDRGGSGGNIYGGVNVDLGVDQIGSIFTGFINIPEDAEYIFTGRSDDHGRVYIDINGDGDFNDTGELVAQRGSGGMSNYTEGPVTLTAGLHAFKALTGEGGGGAGFQVSWEQTNGTNPFAREIIPPSAFTTAIVGDGSFTYDPNGQYETLGVGETATDTFTYSIIDSGIPSASSVSLARHRRHARRVRCGSIGGPGPDVGNRRSPRRTGKAPRPIRQC